MERIVGKMTADLTTEKAGIVIGVDSGEGLERTATVAQRECLGRTRKQSQIALGILMRKNHLIVPCQAHKGILAETEGGEQLPFQRPGILPEPDGFRISVGERRKAPVECADPVAAAAGHPKRLSDCLRQLVCLL